MLLHVCDLLHRRHSADSPSSHLHCPLYASQLSLATVPRTRVPRLHDPKAGGGRRGQKRQFGEKVAQAKYTEEVRAGPDTGRGCECGGFFGRREVVAGGVARGVLAGSPGGTFSPFISGLELFRRKSYDTMEREADRWWVSPSKLGRSWLQDISYGPRSA